MAESRLIGMFVAAVLFVVLSVLWYYQYLESGAVYRAEIAAQNFTHSSTGVPKIIHFIWTDDEFPEELRLHVRSWIDKHPSWKVTLWSDAEILRLIMARSVQVTSIVFCLNYIAFHLTYQSFVSLCMNAQYICMFAHCR